MANDPRVVIREVLKSFKLQHNTEDRELCDYTKNLISHLLKLYNRMQRRNIHRTSFTMRELDEVLHKRKHRENPRSGQPACRTLP